MSRFQLLLAVLLPAFCACTKDPAVSTATGALNFQFKFDPHQARLNNVGQPATLPAGHAAQSPEFRKMSVHYVELAPTAFTALGSGAVLYKAPETTKGGDNAIDFDQATLAPAGENFLKINLQDVAPGTYEWVRVSVAYQNYDVRFNIKNLPVVGNLDQQKGTVASFLGFNTYITTTAPREKTLTVNDDKKQGFWAFETDLSAPYSVYNQLYSGEAPAGATTVVNPLFASSPIPAGSCVVTGKFAQSAGDHRQRDRRYNRQTCRFLSIKVSSGSTIMATANSTLYGDGVTPSGKDRRYGPAGIDSFLAVKS